MACSRCGAKRPQRPTTVPSSLRSGAPNIVPNPAPAAPTRKPAGATADPRSVIMGLNYVPRG